MLNPTHH